CKRRIDEWRLGPEGHTVPVEECRGDATVAATVTGDLHEPEVVCGTGNGGDRAERPGVTAADHGLAINAIGKADVGTEGFPVTVGQGACAHTTVSSAGKQQSARTSSGARVRRGGPEIGEAVLGLNGRQGGLPADAEIQRKLRVDTVIILEIAREIGPLL